MLVANWLDRLLAALADLAPPGSFFALEFNLRSMLALVLVSLACGAVGSLVVGGRMAFFSDALVHCAFASISIAFVVVIFLLPGLDSTNEFWDWVTPIMLVLGMATAYGIAYVFIVLLALVVNLCIRTVGAMLISALLVVPAATACNLTRNLRQLFWCTVVLCLVASLSGPLLSWEIDVRGGPSLAVPGTII